MTGAIAAGEDEGDIFVLGASVTGDTVTGDIAAGEAEGDIVAFGDSVTGTSMVGAVVEACAVGETEGDADSGRIVGLEVGRCSLGTFEDDDSWVGLSDFGSSLMVGSRVGAIDGLLAGGTVVIPGARAGDEDASDGAAVVGPRVVGGMVVACIPTDASFPGDAGPVGSGSGSSPAVAPSSPSPGGAVAGR